MKNIRIKIECLLTILVMQIIMSHAGAAMQLNQPVHIPLDFVGKKGQPTQQKLQLILKEKGFAAASYSLSGNELITPDWQVMAVIFRLRSFVLAQKPMSYAFLKLNLVGADGKKTSCITNDLSALLPQQDWQIWQQDPVAVATIEDNAVKRCQLNVADTSDFGQLSGDEIRKKYFTAAGQFKIASYPQDGLNLMMINKLLTAGYFVRQSDLAGYVMVKP